VKRIVLLGTGTGVGKTFVTCALARALRLAAPDAAVAALKPIETGVDEAAADAAALAAASSGVELPNPHPRFAFPAPVSPHLASRLAGAPPIGPSDVAHWLSAWQQRITSHVMSHMFVLIETAGGTFSPLAPSFTNYELALTLEPALWVLVASDSLGVLHELSATLGACSARGRSPDLVVLSEARPRDASTGTNAAELAALGIVTPCAVLGRDSSSAWELARSVVARAQSSPVAS
jgi:dethiobiotin synthetase